MHSMVRQQQGLTLFTWLVIFMMIGFFVLLGLRLAPVYMQNYSVKNIMADLQQEPLVSRKPMGEIRQMLLRRFDINGIRDLGRENIKLSRSGGKTKVQVMYETRQHIAGNVDVVVMFNESLELTAN
jgi:chaperonin GroEL (HSP60 family)